MRLRRRSEQGTLGRSLVLELARPLGPLVLTALRRDELPRASEAFITSVSREVLPLVRVDGQVVGDGRPGPLGRELRQGFGDTAGVAYVAGAPLSKEATPRRNLTGDPYVTDGLRVVAVFSHARTNAIFLDWASF